MTRSFWLFGARFIVHANHQDIAGRYDMIEGGGLPGERNNIRMAIQMRCSLCQRQRA
jgi:hypothetical protein